jgi:hypothetical protein
MVFRSSAAICGAVITLGISVAVARSEIGAVHSMAAIIGAAASSPLLAHVLDPLRRSISGPHATAAKICQSSARVRTLNPPCKSCGQTDRRLGMRGRSSCVRQISQLWQPRRHMLVA